MGTRHATPQGKDLYASGGDTVAQYLNQRLADDKHPLIVNLASQEYFKVADRPALAARVVDCVFEDWKPDAQGRRPVQDHSFFAKRPVARWRAGPSSSGGAQRQGAAGLRCRRLYLRQAASSADRLVFRRRAAG